MTDAQAFGDDYSPEEILAKRQLRAAVRSAYDLQKLRCACGTRIVGNLKAKLGVKPGVKEEEMTDKEKMNYIKKIRVSYKRITDGVVGNMPTPAKFEKEGLGDEMITALAELTLVNLYEKLLQDEEVQFKLLKPLIAAFPIWDGFLKGVRGVGPAMAGVIISEINISKARYPSSLWKYSGLDVAEDGKGRSRQKAHLIDIEYEDTDGEVKTKKGITFNPFLKTKLTGVLSELFIRMRSDPYSGLYYDYKNRILNRGDEGMTKGHAHNMAKRYIVKRFLADLYNAWRGLEGLPVAPDYHEAKLGHVHGAGPVADPQNDENIVDDGDLADANESVEEPTESTLATA